MFILGRIKGSDYFLLNFYNFDISFRTSIFSHFWRLISQRKINGKYDKLYMSILSSTNLGNNLLRYCANKSSWWKNMDQRQLKLQNALNPCKLPMWLCNSIHQVEVIWPRDLVKIASKFWVIIRQKKNPLVTIGLHLIIC